MEIKTNVSSKRMENMAIYNTRNNMKSIRKAQKNIAFVTKKNQIHDKMVTLKESLKFTA